MKPKYKLGDFVFFFKAQHIYCGKVDSIGIRNTNKDKTKDPIPEVTYSVLDGHNSNTFEEADLFKTAEDAQKDQLKNIKGWKGK
jgi:hypothetical protein